MVADEEGQKVGPVDQDLEVVDQRLAVEEVVGCDEKVPGSVKSICISISTCHLPE